jgi:hypothetical protein
VTITECLRLTVVRGCGPPACPSRPAGGTRSSFRRVGNEQERLALLEGRRADVAAKLAEAQEYLGLIDYKIEVYRGRVTAGDADWLWAATR